MKTYLNIMSMILVFIGLQIKANAAGDTLVVLHLNDTHSNILPIGPKDETLKGTLGGAARVATLLKQIKSQSSNVLTLHAGDSFIGDPVFNGTAGAAELAVLLSMDIDAMAVGNHEFDLGPSMLKQALDTTFQLKQFPLLSANLNLDATEVEPLKQYIQPYIVRQYGTITVGIFGLLTPSTNFLSQPAPAFVDTMILEIAGTMVDTLKSLGCNLIICLSHLGVGIDQAVATYVPGIHLIIGGHDHKKFEQLMPVPNVSGDTTYIGQTDGFYLQLGKITVIVDSDKVKIAEYALLPIDLNTVEDPEIAALVAALKNNVESVFGPLYSQRIGYVAEHCDEVATDLMSNGPKDTPIGNLVTDAFREMFKTDIAMEAGGSTAQPLYKGPIVPADLFHVVGYGFNEMNFLGYRMATFSMNGAALMYGLEFGVSAIESDDEFLLQASGLTYRYNASYPSGSRITEVMIGNEPLDPAKTYTVASNEFTPMVMMTLGIPFENLVIYNDSTEFQTLVAYVTQLDTIYPMRRNSVVSPVIKTDQTSRPSESRLEQNYPNPFNPTTTITYWIPITTDVSIDVYTMLGQKIETLVRENKREGIHTVQWNATHVASGLYFCRLKAGTKIRTMKMLLVR
ncbi:MAG: 5'-nucleotidase C-terminal domain-containing protein [Bacteroidota bacterium]